METVKLSKTLHEYCNVGIDKKTGIEECYESKVYILELDGEQYAIAPVLITDEIVVYHHDSRIELWNIDLSHSLEGNMIYFSFETFEFVVRNAIVSNLRKGLKVLGERFRQITDEETKRIVAKFGDELKETVDMGEKLHRHDTLEQVRKDKSVGAEYDSIIDIMELLIAKGVAK